MCEGVYTCVILCECVLARKSVFECVQECV